MKNRAFTTLLIYVTVLAMLVSTGAYCKNAGVRTAHAEGDPSESEPIRLDEPGIETEDADASASSIDEADSIELEEQGDDWPDLVDLRPEEIVLDGDFSLADGLDESEIHTSNESTASSGQPPREGSYCPAGGMSDESAVAGYIQRAMYPSRAQRTYGSVGTRLKGEAERKLYALLKQKILLVAKGELANTEFALAISDIYDDVAFSAADLGVDTLTYESGDITISASFAFWMETYIDVGIVIDALLADCPYDLYWYDKTWPTSWNYVNCRLDGDRLRILDYSTGKMTFHFPVAAEYAVSGRTGTYLADSGKGQSVQSAANNAQRIIAANAGLDDIQKLTAYKNAICDLVEYNDVAGLGEIDDYGNPWQLIWVFDGDETTKVVCEGYSKAFQYLCEQSQFNGDVSVISVSGMLGTSTGDGGGHMWNLIGMGGVNYLADITNCDEGTAGAPDKLFMKGYSYCQEGSWGTTYYFDVGKKTLNYTFDQRITNLFSAQELDLSDDPVGPENTSQSSGTCGDLKWKMDGNGVLYIYGSGAIPDYSAQNPAPWAGDDVKRAYLSKGITAIGSRAFYDCPNMTTVSVNSGIVSVGADAFNVDSLRGRNVKGVIIPKCTDRAVIDYVNDVMINHVINGHADLVYGAPVPATCVSRGIRSAHCKGCGETYEWYDGPIDPNNHARIVNDKAVAATCTESGKTAGSHCAACNTVLQAQNTIAAKGHTVVTDPAIPATTESEGKTEGKHCKVCGEVLVPQKAIPRLPKVTANPTAKPTAAPTARPTTAPTAKPTAVPTAKPTAAPTAKPTAAPTVKPTAAPTVKPTPVPQNHLSFAKITVKDQVYTGKALKPSVKVVLNGKTLKKSRDYTLSYKNNKNVGTATVLVKAKGKYVGSASATFNINPKSVTGLKLKKGKGQLTASWKKSSGASGYQLEYAMSKDFTSSTAVIVAQASTVKTTLKGLKKGRTYYVRIRANKKVNDTDYWSSWSPTKKARVG